MLWVCGTPRRNATRFSDNGLCKQQGELARPAHRVISLLRTNSVAFRAKRKSAELRFLTGL